MIELSKSRLDNPKTRQPMPSQTVSLTMINLPISPIKQEELDEVYQLLTLPVWWREWIRWTSVDQGRQEQVVKWWQQVNYTDRWTLIDWMQTKKRKSTEWWMLSNQLMELMRSIKFWIWEKIKRTFIVLGLFRLSWIMNIKLDRVIRIRESSFRSMSFKPWT